VAKLLKIISGVGPAFVLLFLVACRTADSQTTPTREASAQPAATQPPTANQLPDWIVNPATLPPGRVGKNNCKFEFGHEGADLKVHRDAGCWEHEGPGGWTRQQFQKIHVPKLPECNDRSADLTGIRVCRAGGKDQDSPCGGKTGPTGCARCVANPKCH